MLQAEQLSTYRFLLKSLVRSGMRSRVKQAVKESKKEIAKLTYQKIQLVRRQSSLKDHREAASLLPELNALTKRITQLKNDNPASSKKLLYYPFARELRSILFEDAKDEATLARRLQHMKDIANFSINQSEYEELIERYNPGMKMTQQEKVQRTAAKVGLQVPADLQA